MKGTLGDQGKGRWRRRGPVAAAIVLCTALLVAAVPVQAQLVSVNPEKVVVDFGDDNLYFTVVASATILNVWIKLCVYGEVRSGLFNVTDIFNGGSTNVFDYTDTEVITDVWVKTGTTDDGGPGVHFPNGNAACPPPPGEDPPLECGGPEEVAAVAEGEDIVVDWTAVAGADTYRVFRALEDGDFFFLTEVEAPTTHLVDDTVEANTTYHYTVTAVIGGEETDACASAEVKTNEAEGPPPPPPACEPANVQVTPVDQDVTLSWDAVDNATEYNVYRANETGDFALIANVTGTSFTDTSVEANTTYRYQVAAMVDGNETEACAAVQVRTNGTGGDEEEPVCAPDTVQAMTSGEDIWVTWSSVENATQYRLHRATGSGGFSLLATVDGDNTEYRDDMVDPGVTYRYRVTAMVDGNETAPCMTAEATAIPDFPTLAAGLVASLVGLAAYMRGRRRR